MSLNDDLKGVLTCSFCQKYFEQPIMLPCQETICRKDLAKLYMRSSQEDVQFRTFKCPLCECVHEEPLGGFPDDKKMKKLLELHGIGSGSGSGGGSGSVGGLSAKSFNVAKACCARLSDLYDEYTNVKEDPYAYIDKYFDRVRKVIENNREENKQIIDQVHDQFLKELKKIENECMTYTKTNHDSDRGSNNYETYSEFSNVPSQLTEWLDELNLHKSDSNKCESINTQVRKLERELSTKCEQFKRGLLLNKEVKFKQKALEKDMSNFGQLKWGDVTTTITTLAHSPSSSGLARRESVQGRGGAEQSLSQVDYCDSDVEQQYLHEAVRSAGTSRRQSRQVDNLTSSNEDRPNKPSRNGQHARLRWKQAVKKTSLVSFLKTSASTTLSSTSASTLASATQPSAPVSTKNLYITVTDYDAKTSDELSFEKGDILIINESDKRTDTQWIGNVYKRANSNSHLSSSPGGGSAGGAKTSGVVCPAHVAKKAFIENEPWYFGNIKRKEAELLLKRDANPAGAYMIRESETNSDASHCFSLSVRDPSTEIKHYRILSSVEHSAFVYFLNPKVKFKSLNELIDYHSKKAEGLCTILTVPCKK